MELRVLDVRDETDLRRWWEVGAAANAERPGDPWPAWEANRVALAADNSERDQTLVLALDGDEPVGAHMYLLPLNDNLHAAYADLFVVPARRREGIGRLLLADIEERTRSAGRTTLLVEATAAPGQQSAGSLFGAAHGYALANREEIKVLDLPGTAELRAGLQAEADAHAGDYRIVTWDTRCPDEYVAEFCRLLSGFLAQIPLGDMDLEDSEWTPERLRANEARMVGIGRRMFAAAAVAPDGSLVGCSDVRVSEAAPERGDVGITLVSEGHRGHRLGLAMKLATHRMLVEAFPECRRVTTSNAGVNAQMAAVNERLGYTVVEDLLELQKVLTD